MRRQAARVRGKTESTAHGPAGKIGTATEKSVSTRGSQRSPLPWDRLLASWPGQENRLQRMAQAMGLPSGGDIPQAITDMNARLGLPTGLAEMGVRRDWFDRIIQGALADHCHQTNPRIASREEDEEMLASAM